MSSNDSVGLILSVVGALSAIVLLGVPAVLDWRKLARTFPDRPFVARRSYSSLSGQVGGCWGLYRNLLKFELGDEGIRISMPRLLRWAHPTFLIPWIDIKDCRREPRLFGADGVCLSIKGLEDSIYLSGFLWRHGDAASTIVNLWNECRQGA